MAQLSPRETVDRHRLLFKRTTPPWKETYRKRCLSRFRQSRERLVDTFRRFTVTKDELANGNEIPEMMDQEWDSLQREEIFDGLESVDELVALKNEIYQEILEEEQRIVSEYELSLDDDFSRLGPSIATDSNSVLCPMCQRSMLIQSGNVIHCDCGLRIDTEQDCLTLSHLRQQLTVGLDAHNSACSTNPQFSQMDTYGISNLLITCSSCDFMFIVI